MAISAEPDQNAHSIGLHCLQRIVCLNILGRQDTLWLINAEGSSISIKTTYFH